MKSFQLYGTRSQPTCMLQNDMRGYFYSKAPGVAVCFRFHRDGLELYIIYMTALVYITYILELLDFALLYIYMNEKCLCVGGGWIWKKYIKQRAEMHDCVENLRGSKKRSCFFFYYFYVCTPLYSLSFGALKTLVS